MEYEPVQAPTLAPRDAAPETRRPVARQARGNGYAKESLERAQADQGCSSPQDRASAVAPLPAPDWGAIFDADEGYQGKIRKIAEYRAVHAVRKSTKGTVPKFHQRQLDAGQDRAAARQEGETLTPDDVNQIGVEEKTEAEFETLRYEFVRVAGMGSHPVGKVVGRINKEMKEKAGRLEKDLRRSEKDASAGIEAELCGLRAGAQTRLDEEIATYKTWFLTSAEEQKRFDCDAANAKLPGPSISAPSESDKAEAVEMPSEIQGSGPIGPALIPFLRAFQSALKEQKVRAGFTSYGENHNWGPFSVDVWLGPESEDGFVKEDVAHIFFATIKDVAAEHGVRWQALYNDFDVAKRANQENKSQRVRFQWLHGPGPFKNHVHLDLQAPKRR